MTWCLSIVYQGYPTPKHNKWQLHGDSLLIVAQADSSLPLGRPNSHRCSPPLEKGELQVLRQREAWSQKLPLPTAEGVSYHPTWRKSPVRQKKNHPCRRQKCEKRSLSKWIIFDKRCLITRGHHIFVGLEKMIERSLWDRGGYHQGLLVVHHH